ncbi:MAG: hypothetical protein HND47_06905 [Chloroflexi bacterium]|nr:hypothetical protein [Chloroflexota bacterium]
MPDADKVRNLSHRWSKMYKKICEGHFNNATLAEDAMRALAKDVGDYRDPPIRLLKEAAIRLEGIRNGPLFRPVYNWSDEDNFIRKLASSYIQNYRANQRGINLAISVYKRLISKLRNGEAIAGNFKEVLCREYIREIYDSNFTERIPLVSNNDIDPDWNSISQRLNEINSLVDRKIGSLASRIAQKGNVRRIRFNSRRLPQRPITIEDDISSIGNRI